MKYRIKHIKLVSCFLIAVLVMPQLQQAYHVLTVHHHKTHCTAKDTKHLHKASEYCPIHEYVFATTHKIGLPAILSKIEYKTHKYLTDITTALHLVLRYSYYLRAPPDYLQNNLNLFLPDF